jgi:hypothetical protein
MRISTAILQVGTLTAVLQGASTWGSTEMEALKNIDLAMLEHGEAIPEEAAGPGRG